MKQYTTYETSLHEVEYFFSSMVCLHKPRVYRTSLILAFRSVIRRMLEYYNWDLPMLGITYQGTSARWTTNINLILGERRDLCSPWL